MKSVESLLNQLGLTDDEINIYLLSLKKGALTLQQVQNDLALTLLSINSAVDELIRKNILSRSSKGDENYIQSEHPEKVITVLQQNLSNQQRALEDLKNYKAELESDMSAEIPSVKFFEGKQGLFEMLDEFNAMKTPEALLIFSPEHVHEAFSDEERTTQISRRIEKKISTRSIRSSLKDAPCEMDLSKQKIIPAEKFPMLSDIEIYDDKVAIASLKEPYHGVIIESKSIADSFRSIFELAWIGAEQETYQAQE